MRPAALPELRPLLRPVRGKSVSLRQLLPRLGDEALARGDAGLDGGLDAVRDLRDLLRHDVVAAGGLAPAGAGPPGEAAPATADEAPGAPGHPPGRRLGARPRARPRGGAARGRR